MGPMIKVLDWTSDPPVSNSWETCNWCRFLERLQSQNLCVWGLEVMSFRVPRWFSGPSDLRTILSLELQMVGDPLKVNESAMCVYLDICSGRVYI